MADNDTTQPAGTGDGEGASEGGFSEAFAERATGPSGEDQGKTPEAGAEASAENNGKPAEEAGSAQAPPDKGAADAGTGTKAPAFDPFAGLTPEQKAHFDKLAASERSNRGRVGALTKKLNGVIGSGTQAPPTATAGASRGTDDDGTEGSATGKPASEQSAADIEAKLTAAREGEYGDIVGPLAEVVTDLRKEIAGLQASATRHEVDQNAAELAEAYKQLEEAHSDYQQVADDPKFHTEWLGAQPKGVQVLANSYDPREISLVLSLYKAEQQAASQATGESGEGEGGTATGDKRERQLDALRQPTSRGTPAAAGVPDDFKAAFKVRSQKG